MFHVKLSTDNAAFEGDRAAEVARILRAIADRLEAGVWQGNARDANGNTVGGYALTLEG